MLISWLISAGMGIGVGAVLFWINGPAMVVRAVMAEGKRVPLWLQLVLGTALVTAIRSNTTSVPSKHAPVAATILSLAAAAVSIALFNYGVWGSHSIWDDVSFGTGKIILAETGFPPFTLLTLLTLTGTLNRYLRKLKPHSSS